jgi:triphosphoribosyl-dephospho-CoA synthase
MRLAADWDMIARQYANGFQQVLGEIVPRLLERADRLTLIERIVDTHVWLISEYPDSLIARKCGRAVAQEAAVRAAVVLQAGAPASEDYLRELAELDFWLRSDGNRRNPGTTADLIAAGLFVALRDGLIGPPFR